MFPFKDIMAMPYTYGTVQLCTVQQCDCAAFYSTYILYNGARVLKFHRMVYLLSVETLYGTETHRTVQYAYSVEPGAVGRLYDDIDSGNRFQSWLAIVTHTTRLIKCCEDAETGFMLLSHRCPFKIKIENPGGIQLFNTYRLSLVLTPLNSR